MQVAPLHPQELDRQLTVSALELNSPTYLAAYDGVVRLLRAAAHVPICLFSIIDNDRQFFKACVGLNDRQTPRDFAFCAHAILQPDLHQIFHVEDAAKHPDFFDNPLVTGSPYVRFYAGIPVRAPNGLPVGTLCVIDTSPRPLSALLAELLNLGRGLLENQLAMFAESVSDPLTGLRNRRFLQESLAREWRRAYRHLMPITLMLIDIDHFKAYNDRYGHPAGDEALKQVAHVITASCHRPGDQACRYGGEEFLAVLPETNREGAEKVAHNLAASLKQTAIRHAESPTGVLTMSIGVVVLSERAALELGYEHGLARADQALYQAKKAGRNQVQFVELKDDGDLTA